MISEEFPLLLTTGRTVYQFHTRTKTGRVPQLNAAAPDVWVEVSAADAGELGLGEGDRVRVESPRGRLEALVRVSGIRPGMLFLPFHFGYWDRPGGDAPDGDGPRAANELTLTGWDPVSKQPLLKVAAVRVTKLADAAGPSPAPDPTAVPATVGGPVAEAVSRPEES